MKVDATRRLVEQLAETGVDAVLTQHGCDEHLPPPVVAGGVFRIVQESLTNAVKHGGPDVKIVVSVDCVPSAVEIIIRSSLPEPPAPGSVGGSGVAGMAERASVLGGTFEAGPEHGDFVVRSVLPTRTNPTAGDGQR